MTCFIVRQIFEFEFDSTILSIVFSLIWTSCLSIGILLYGDAYRFNPAAHQYYIERRNSSLFSEISGTFMFRVTYQEVKIQVSGSARDRGDMFIFSDPINQIARRPAGLVCRTEPRTCSFTDLMSMIYSEYFEYLMVVFYVLHYFLLIFNDYICFVVELCC